jgi:dTDP-4-amino-4,6-dideoxy-D-galactose acyltransferase
LSDLDSAEPGLLLEWDSAFWGVTVARVRANALTPESWAEVDAWARTQDVDCLYFLSRPDDPETVGVAQNAGFRLVDVRVELDRPSDRAESAERVRPLRPGDLKALRAIARTSHEITRFYADPHFPRERCSDFYDTWIVRSSEGWADAVLVAEFDDRAVGYVTCHLDAASRRGSIGLIAVSEAARGHQLGHSLVHSAIGWCRTNGAGQISVVTQGANVPAQRVFQQCGFRTLSVGLWFHLWYGR